MGVTIQLRRGRESYWNGAGATVIPAQGETVLIFNDSASQVIGVKYGDGITQMQSLPLFNSGSGSGSYDSSDFDADFNAKTTDDLAEGSANKYIDTTQKSKIDNLPSDTQSEIDTLSTSIDGKLSAVRDTVVTPDVAYTAQSDDSGKIVIHTYSGGSDKKLIVGDSLPNGHLSVHVAAAKEMTIEKAGGATVTLVYDGYDIRSGDSFFLVKANDGSNKIWVIRTVPSAPQIRDMLESLAPGSRLSYDFLDDVPPGSGYTSTDFDTDFAAKTTDDLAEGSANKYVTAADEPKIANLPADTAGDISTINTTLTTKVDKVRENSLVSSAEYTVVASDSMKFLIHTYNGGSAKKLLVDDDVADGFTSFHIVKDKAMTVELAPGSTDTLSYDGSPLNPGTGFMVHRSTDGTATVYVVRFQADVSDIAAALTSDDIAEGSTNKYVTAAEEAKLANVPADTNASIADAARLKDVALSTNTTVSPANSNTYFSYAEAGDIQLTFDEDLASDPKFPSPIAVRMRAGSGNISLVGDGANTLTVGFKDLSGNDITAIPGGENRIVSFVLQPGTDEIYDVYGLETTVVRNITFTGFDEIAGATLNGYSHSAGDSDNAFVALIWSGGTPYTAVTYGGVSMTKEAECDSGGTPNLWIQIWRVKQADMPGNGSINIAATGGGSQSDTQLRVFRMVDSEQTTIGLLDTTGDGSNSRIVFDRADNTDKNTIAWPLISGTALFFDVAIADNIGASWSQLAHQTGVSSVNGSAISSGASYSKRTNLSTNMREVHNIGTNENMAHLSFYLLQASS